MTMKTKAARNCCNSDRAKIVHVHGDEHIIHDDYERGTFYAGLAMFGMFVFLIGWMWFTW